MNISLHDPELYYFLSLLTGIAALLASLYEFSSPRRRNRAKPLDIVDQIKPLPRPVPLDRAQQDFAGHQSPSGRATDGGQSVPAAEEKIDESPRQAGEQAAEQFSRLCENVKDLSPKEQARRMNEHFGIFGGAPPPKDPGRERR
jgi:hypothetical protein